jgi:transposase-like protein
VTGLAAGRRARVASQNVVVELRRGQATDAHTNTCENHHSFLRQWLAKFRGVSKHHLQKYLNFLALKLNPAENWFEKILCYNVSG